jgi:hypothetical protein
MADDLKRVVAWKSLLINGTDYCALWHTAEGWLLRPIYAATFFPTNDPQATLATNRSNIQILGFDSRSAIGCGIVLSPQ